jgi:serine/threonine protein kinase
MARCNHLIGNYLAHFEVLAKIGEGGMGEVYRARGQKLGRDVALNILPRDMSGDPERIARFQREARQYEIYVRSIAAGGRSWSVSVDGGEEPIWSSDGSEIFFRAGSEFLRTPVLEASDDGSRFRAGAPKVFVSGAYANVPGVSYEVVPGDDRLLLLRTDGGTERPAHLNVILNFDEVIDAAFE